MKKLCFFPTLTYTLLSTVKPRFNGLMRKYNCLLLEKTRILPSVDQAYSQEFVMGVAVAGVEPPAAGGQWGSGGKASAAGGKGSGGRASTLGNFYDFSIKNNAFLRHI